MKKIREQSLRPWIKRHPFLSRITIGCFLPFLPLALVCVVAWSERHSIAGEFMEAFRIVFLPWEGDDHGE